MMLQRLGDSDQVKFSSKGDELVMISIDLGVIRSKVKVTRADSFSTISGL